jgi:flavin-dependent dehydrogenase
MERSASEPELRPLFRARDRYDVVILGGGLAGLTLAIQLKQARPETSIAVLEKREDPAPEAAFKVGESTVPAGAHYFAEVVGLKEYLLAEHLRKCGLRFFLPAGDNGDITRRIENGPPRWPVHENYQIDRGRFENELMTRVRRLGVDVLQGARVSEVRLDSGGHTVRYSQFGQDISTIGHWVVDAAGRASLLKRQLGIGRPVGHTINSSWLRLRGGLDLEEWGKDDASWMARVSEPGLRTYSTNHLLGQGYWVWLIPLSSGRISIGLCADPRFHPFEEMNELDRLVRWFGDHEPQLAAALEQRLGEVEDFLRIEDFAFGCERVFSGERWCLVGEAGAFADPFYSPGSDFIAYGNTFTADLIARELSGEDVSERLEYFNSFFLRSFEKTLVLYEDQYQLFGNSQVMIAKLAWDTYINHWAPALLLIKGKLTDLNFMRAVDADIDRTYRLNARMQQFFREWHALHQREYEGLFAGIGRVQPVLASNVALVADYDDDALMQMFHRNADVLEALAVGIFRKASSALDAQVDDDQPINPYAISLEPGRWEADGLLTPGGLSWEEARASVEGLDHLWLD